MKVKLNLLPKSKEKKLKNKKMLQFLIWQELLIIAATFFFFGLIKGVERVADLRFGQVGQEIFTDGRQDEYRQIREYENNIKNSMEKINLIGAIQENNIDWLRVFDKFPAVLSEAVRFDSIKGEGLAVTISGVAKDRDALIKVKKGFEEDACFNEVSIPLNDIVLKSDIKFEMKFSVNEKCLKNYEK